jgi:predicted metal-dependent hydrolase
MEQGFLELKHGAQVPFRVARSSQRKRSYALQVKPDGVVEFRAPRWVSLAELLRFGQSRHRFIRNRLAELALRSARQTTQAREHGPFSPLPPRWYAKAAKQLLTPRLAHWAGVIGVSVAALRITAGRTVWGSCSSDGKIALSWRLLLVPAELREYVVIHELCHRKYMSHGPRFWALVGKYVPDYIAKRRALNKLGADIG